MKKQWNKDIRDRLKDFPKKAPESLLDDIKSEMTRRCLTSAQSNHKRIGLLLRIVSITATLFILLGINILWEKDVNLQPTTKHADSSTSFTVSPNITETEVLESQPSTSSQLGLIAQPNKTTTTYPEVSISPKETLPQAGNENIQEENKRIENEQPEETKKDNVQTYSKPKWTYNVSSSKKKSSISIGVYYSGIIAQTYSRNFTTSDIPVTSGPGQNTDNGNPTDSTEVARSRRATTTYHLKGKATHYLPVKLGLSFRYNLDEHWNIQSGLMYSYLASDISENIAKDSYHTKQKLHYIGIPLQIGYKIGESKRFRSYIVAGGQVEKLVSGKATTRHSKNNSLGTYIQDISDKKLLFSALASFGVEYALGKTFSLYAEPGIHYYFKNNNGLQTHYNEQPLNFDLNIGFRFHWSK